MGKEDVYESDYLENAEIFADLVNGVLYQGEDQTLSSQAKILLTKLANIKKIPNVTGEKFKKGDFDVYKAFKDMKEEGRIEGEKQRRLEGRAREIVELGNEFGLSEKKILKKLQNKLNVSEKKARKYFTMFAEQAF